MSVPTEDVFFKTVDDKNRPVIARLVLPQVDVADAVGRFPEQYSRTIDGFADKPRPKPADDIPTLLGQPGGNPDLIGGIGVREIIRDPKEKLDDPKVDPKDDPQGKDPNAKPGDRLQDKGARDAKDYTPLPVDKHDKPHGKG